MKHQLTILLLLFSCIVSAQVRVSITANAGVGYVYDKKKNEETSYKPMFAPGGNCNLIIPVSKKLVIQTGLGYMQKGLSSHRYATVSVRSSIDYFVTTRFQYLSVPLLVGYKFYNARHTQSWIDFGMNYGFYLAGKSFYNVKEYYKDKLINTMSYESMPKSGFTQGLYVHKQVASLEVMLKLQYRLLIGTRYIAGLYYEHSLYPYTINSTLASDARFRNTGILLGYNF